MISFLVVDADYLINFANKVRRDVCDGLVQSLDSASFKPNATVCDQEKNQKETSTT